MAGGQRKDSLDLAHNCAYDLGIKSNRKTKDLGKMSTGGMNVLWTIYATPGGIYATGKNPFGRDSVGYIWAESGSAAVSKYAARENLDSTQLQY